MKYRKLLMCVVPLLAAVACSDDDGVTDLGPPPPAASIRFVNAVVDIGTVDLRFVDLVENLPSLQGVAFRGHSGMYQRAEPGTRAARIFPNSTNLDTTQILLVDTTVPLTAGTRYTMVYAGRTAAGAPADEAHRLAVLTDPAVPTPPTNSIAIKVLHVGVGLGNVDVYAVRVDSAGAATPADWDTNYAARVQNVSYLAQSAYVDLPVLSSGLYRFVVTDAGSTTPLFTATPNQPGQTSSVPTAGPQPGVRIAGSVLTAVVASGSTPGTRQSTAANQSPTVFFMIDKVLNP